MKLYRFCSFDELSKLLRGEKIYNHTDHFNSGKEALHQPDSALPPTSLARLGNISEA